MTNTMAAVEILKRIGPSRGTYTQRHNGRYKLLGHLFSGRYKTVIVDGKNPQYLQVVSMYIHFA